VDELDYADDYLYSQEDTGKKKGDVAVQKLSEMNPFSSISYAEIEIEPESDE
jgi:molybdopterin/thiamine biosynthesis adenylyltransferase